MASCESLRKKPLSKQPIVVDTPKALHEQLIAKDTAVPSVDKEEPPQSKFKTHLQDTTYVEGSFILFLRPNDSRYAELESISEEGLGDADSDFGVGINKTLDSLKKNPDYTVIKGSVSQNRYIYIIAIANLQDSIIPNSNPFPTTKSMTKVKQNHTHQQLETLNRSLC